MWFIAWGTKQVRDVIGYVADECPTCQSIQAFALCHDYVVRHVYWIPMGQGQLVDRSLVCESCHRAMPVGDRVYRNVVTRRGADLHELIAETNPALLTDGAPHRMPAVPDHAAPLDPDPVVAPSTREHSIREALERIAGQAERRLALESDFDGQTGKKLAVTLFGGIGMIVAAVYEPLGVSGAFFVLGALVTFFGGAAVTQWDSRKAPWRGVAADLLPRAVRALAVVRPSRDELAVAINALARTYPRFASRLEAEELERAVSAVSRAPDAVWN